MIAAFVYYNQDSHAYTVNHGTLLACINTASRIELPDHFTSDEDVCELIFAGLNQGSGREYDWFMADTKLRSMRSGDVITIIRFGERKTSYCCETLGWKLLPAPVSQPGPYDDPLREPELWHNNDAFIRDCDELCQIIAKVRLSALILKHSRLPKFNPYNAAIARIWLRDLHDRTLVLQTSQVRMFTPGHLRGVIFAALSSLTASDSELADPDTFISYIANAEDKLQSCMVFTQRRMEEHARKVISFNEQREAAPASTPPTAA